MFSDDAADDPYGKYYREVELHWSWRRESQIILSPLEFEQIESWFEGDIPLAVVLRAIDLFIEKKKQAKRQRAYLLTHAKGTVEKVFREYETLHRGRGDDEADLLTSKMKALIRKVKALIKSFPEEAEWLKSLVGTLQGMSLDDVVEFDDIDAELVKLDCEMVMRFKGLVAPEDLAAITSEVEDLLTEDEDPEFYAKLISDSVRAHMGLPRLTVLG